ncbi:MAG: hypothetical protein KY460_11800 [Actinobacteria bacterium]|nr:hypothetical protein [Actinomycetota bacterium]
MRINTQYLHRIAVDIDRYGTSAVESDLAQILDLAREARITSPAVSVLADESASDVVRTRALGVVIAQLARTAAPGRTRAGSPDGERGVVPRPATV